MRRALCLILLAITGSARAGDAEFFEKKVRPVLVENCFKCHSGDKTKGNLHLDSRSGLLKGGDSGPALVPGNPEASLIVKAIRYKDDLLRMPPRSKLPDEQIEAIAIWIQQGAIWPEERSTAQRSASGGFNLQERRKHWAWQPVRAGTPPSVRQSAWPRTPIDAFILNKLEAAGLRPTVEADKRTWLRRVTYDLIGLPPTPDDIHAFLADESPQAYERVVDRLLASAHYGERWGRHWLDLVRYADTRGHEFDFDIPQSYTYRDYVVRCFNEDLPYDQFVREQIAGDLLSKPRQSVHGTNESIIGTGFWFLGEAKHSPVDLRAEEADQVDNQIDVFGKTFLGLTLACARCHDHKFDAISTRDYYALTGYLQSSRLQLAFLDEPVKPHTSGDLFDLRTWDTSGSGFVFADGMAHSGLQGTGLAGVLRSPTFVLNKKKIYYHIAGRNGTIRLVIDNFQMIRAPIYGGLEMQVRHGDTFTWLEMDVSMWQGHRAYIELIDDGPGYLAIDSVAVQNEPPPSTLTRTLPEPPHTPLQRVPRALAMADGTGWNARLAIRGNPNNLGPAVPRRFLEALDGDKHTTPTEGSGRLDLAERLADPANPLVARVLVNRLWQHHFGEGLVRSVDNFGVMGEPPTHPELLDFLADDFVRHGWSIKRMHRQMVLSSTYRMGSHADSDTEVRDPQNRLLHRMPIRRLEAECIRDALLAISGRLNPRMGGPGVMPYLTEHMQGRGRPIFSGPLDGDGRRSLYLAVRRNFPNPLLTAFDYPVPFTTMGRRTISNVPAQALTLLNNPLSLQQSERWAQRVLALPDSSAAQPITLMYEMAFGRLPTDAETAAALSFLSEQGQSRQAWADLAHVLVNVKEFIFLR